MANFDQIYQDHAQYVHDMCFRLCGPGPAGDDLYQDVFLRVHRFLDSYKGGSMKAWLRRITVNTFYTSKRARREVLTLDDDLPGLEIRDPGLTTSGQADRNEQRARLEAAIRQMPPDSRDVLLLRNFEELEYQEIAERLQIPIGTVRSRLARARSALRVALEQ